MVSSQSFYAGFMEFGTKGNYRSIPGYEDIAAQLKGIKGGSMKDFLDNIQRWVKRKGILFSGMDYEETAWVIANSIMVKGVRAQPYFFKQVEPTRQKLVKDLQAIEKVLD